jgi:transketolase
VEDLDLKRRVLEIGFKNNLSHLGSYFSALNIIDKIYAQMSEDDIFILSSGHAAVALYAVIEKYHNISAEELFKKHGGHPHRDEENKIYCSTGSLGLGLTVAVGRALADRSRDVYCLISDGECAEGSIWESLRFIQENNIKNIKVYVNINGYAAYDAVDEKYLSDRLKVFYPDINLEYTTVNHFSFLKGLNAHYHIMSEEDYSLALEECKNEKRLQQTATR